MHLAKDGKGYYKGDFLSDSGEYKQKKFHQMVAITYLGPATDNMEVNHKDGNPLNCRPDNLEYCTHAYNMKHASKNGLLKVGTQRKNAKLTEEDIIAIRKYRKEKGPKYGVKELAEKYNVCAANISNIVNGIRWKHIK